MKSQIETITPGKARELLGSNTTENRTLRSEHVRYLAEQMTRGHWQVTHQGIAISKSGRLLDGQHRLAAIVETGKSVQMVVTTGMDDEAYKVIDSGLKRAAPDRIHFIDNTKQNVMLCQIIGAYVRYGTRKNGALAVSDLEDQFLYNADHWLWIVTKACPPPKIYGRTGILAAIAIYHSVNKDKAEQFCSSYLSGEDLKGDNPILALRRSIEKTGNTSSSDYWRAMSAIRAHRDGRSLTAVFEAAEDVAGNKNSIRLRKEREKKTQLGIKNRRKVAV